MLESKSVCHQGKVRDQNEDSCIDSASLGLWVVADGVGGNGNGDIASQLATQTIERKIRQGAEIADAVSDANNAITEAIADTEELSNMATTVVACHIDHHRYELSWVGDSRAYLIDSAGISQVTVDHNLAAALFEQGQLTSEEVNQHPGQHELTQALGQMTLDKIPVSLGELHHQDILLLCTDGLSGVLNNEQIFLAIQRADSLESACDDLLQQVLDLGAPDNVTFSLIQFIEEEAVIAKSDFDDQSFRSPFDGSSYLEHCKSRPMLLIMILLSIASLLLFF